MWYQLQIEGCPKLQIDELSDLLEEYGAVSVMLTDKNDDPVLEPLPGTTPLWPEVLLHALFDEENSMHYAKASLSASYGQLIFSSEILPEKDWQTAFKNDCKPQCFGKRLWVCPSWHTPPELESVNLILDPGLAFGTGTHPTTSLCLQWLDQADLTNKTVIDFGCGSGILGLAALKLGASHVNAVDIDNQALQATESNADLNEISKQLLTIGTPEILQEPVDIILANILLNPLIQLKLQFFQLLHTGGSLIVSGILEEQAAVLIKEYESHFRQLSTLTMGGWALIHFVSLSGV